VSPGVPKEALVRRPRGSSDSTPMRVRVRVKVKVKVKVRLV